MYCKNCGAQLPDGTRFCTNCGYSQSEDGPGRAYPRAERPSTYLVLSILVTIFCCLPFGIVGIVYASKVDSSWYAGRADKLVFGRNSAECAIVDSVCDTDSGGCVVGNMVG